MTRALLVGVAFATAVLAGRWMMGIALARVSDWIGAGERRAR